jgi:PAS domain S-box-containing protein
MDEKLETVFNLATMAIATTDSNLLYDRVNPAFCDLTGYSAGELIGRPAGSIFGEADGVLDSARHDNFSFARKDGTCVRVTFGKMRLAVSTVDDVGMAEKDG